VRGEDGSDLPNFPLRLSSPLASGASRASLSPPPPVLLVDLHERTSGLAAPPLDLRAVRRAQAHFAAAQASEAAEATAGGGAGAAAAGGRALPRLLAEAAALLGDEAESGPRLRGGATAGEGEGEGGGGGGPSLKDWRDRGQRGQGGTFADPPGPTPLGGWRGGLHLVALDGSGSGTLHIVEGGSGCASSVDVSSSSSEREREREKERAHTHTHTHTHACL